jgi:hypothetical protein
MKTRIIPIPLPQIAVQPFERNVIASANRKILLSAPVARRRNI